MHVECWQVACIFILQLRQFRNAFKRVRFNHICISIHYNLTQRKYIFSSFSFLVFFSKLRNCSIQNYLKVWLVPLWLFLLQLFKTLCRVHQFENRQVLHKIRRQPLFFSRTKAALKEDKFEVYTQVSLKST